MATTPTTSVSSTAHSTVVALDWIACAQVARRRAHPSGLSISEPGRPPAW